MKTKIDFLLLLNIIIQNELVVHLEIRNESQQKFK